MTHIRQPIAWFGVIAALLFGLGLLAVLTALHDRGFLVTQTYVFDTPVTIERSTGSAFKDFFLGQTIEARGTMEVNLGIDLAAVGEDDVTLDETAGTVTVHIPHASLFNTRLVGPIEVKNRQGILKRIFDADDGYNEAFTQLSKTAEATATRPELVERAEERAREDVARLLGYTARGTLVKVETR
jgi:hypothetical protein